jgi:hypothetical protein
VNADELGVTEVSRQSVIHVLPTLRFLDSNSVKDVSRPVSQAPSLPCREAENGVVTSLRPSLQAAGRLGEISRTIDEAKVQHFVFQC